MFPSESVSFETTFIVTEISACVLVTSRLGGVGIDVIAQETIKRHHIAYPPGGEIPGAKRLQIGGEYQWRREGEPHLFDPGLHWHCVAGPCRVLGYGRLCGRLVL